MLLPVVTLDPQDGITRLGYPQGLFPELDPVLDLDSDSRKRYRLESSDLV